VIVRHTGGFHSVDGDAQTGWLQMLFDSVRLPTGRTALRRLVPLGVILLVLAMATLLIVRRRWKTILPRFPLTFHHKHVARRTHAFSRWTRVLGPIVARRHRDVAGRPLRVRLLT